MTKQDASNGFSITRIFAIGVLCIMAILGLFADYLCSEKPIYVKYQGKSYYPLFADNGTYDSLPNVRSGKRTWQRIADADWKYISYEKAIWTLCPFNTKFSGNQKLQAPFSQQKILHVGTSHDLSLQNMTDTTYFTHYMGTDIHDIDVLASIIQGTRTSLLVGIGGLLLISFLGLSLGGMAGYFGNTKLIVTRGQQYGIFLGIFLGGFYGFYVPRYQIEMAFLNQEIGKGLLWIALGLSLFIGNILLFAWLGKKASFIPFLQKRKAFPIDNYITQITDIQMALPVILVVIALSLMLPRSILTLIVIIGFANYMGLARLTRSLTSQIRNLPYIEAAEALGISQLRIVWRHILPNVLPSLISILLLNMADLILLEASFSFLNIGVPLETVSWGKIINQARTAPSAWWLSLFPTLMIAATAGAFKIVGRQK